MLAVQVFLYKIDNYYKNLTKQKATIIGIGFQYNSIDKESLFVLLCQYKTLKSI